MLLLALLGCPLIAALAMAVLPSKGTPSAVYEALHLLSLAGVAVAGLALVVAVCSGADVYAAGEWFHLDGLSALFLGSSPSSPRARASTRCPTWPTMWRRGASVPAR